MGKASPLTSVSATRAVLEAHGLATKKALGQHFLISDGVVSRILDVADVCSEDVVLEVGPGIGTLTIALLDRAGAVVAIERDADLPAVLAETCAGHAGSFTLVCGDALDIDAQSIAEARVDSLDRAPGKLVANLPYAVAATIVLDYFERFESIESETVMIQAEVADRMCAQSGTKEYGSYTVKLGLHARIIERFSVGAKNFFPPPHVDSAVVRLDRCAPVLEGKPLAPEEIAAACMMADASFANRRKTIANSCKNYFSARGEKGAYLNERLSECFRAASVDPRRRGETLSLEEFMLLGQAVYERMKS